MSKTIIRPTLSLGNHIYLYRLLRDAIGCGKQTFMTQVEEALAAGDMTAYDLGFESTRELLEELDDCIKLTVFKGGRLYATVIANEAWDAALAKGEDKPKTAKGAKQSYKKKKRGEKDLKAVRPKHVKRPEPEAMVEAAPEPEPETEIEVAIEVTAEAETEIAATTDPKVISEQEAVDATRKRLREAGFAEKLENGTIEVICDSHEHLTDHVKTFIQAAVFNLGYLPGADKGCTTSASSTMRAVRSCLSRLEPDGLVCITMYSGHPAGRQEKEHLLAFAENLDKRQWHCAYINLINQPAAPPEILLITRKKRPE